LHVISAIGEQEFPFDKDFEFDGSTVFVSETGDAITYSVASIDADIITSNKVTDAKFTLTPKGTDEGKGVITLRASAGGQEMDYRLRIEALDPKIVIQEENIMNTETAPAAWTCGGTETTWRWDDAVALSSDYMKFGDLDTEYIFAINSDSGGENGDKREGRLISPEYDLSGLKDVKLVFDYLFYAGYEDTSNQKDYRDYMQIDYRTASDADWTLLHDFASDSTPWIDARTSVPAEALSATTQFSFSYTDKDNWSFGAAIDNFTIWGNPNP